MKKENKKRAMDSLQLKAASSLVSTSQWTKELTSYWKEFFDSNDGDILSKEKYFVEKILFCDPFLIKGDLLERQPEFWRIKRNLKIKIKKCIHKLLGYKETPSSYVDLLIKAIEERFKLLMELNCIIACFEKEIGNDELTLQDINIADVLKVFEDQLFCIDVKHSIAIACRYGLKEILNRLLLSDAINGIRNDIKYVLRNIVFLDPCTINDLKFCESFQVNIREVLSDDYQYYIETKDIEVIKQIFEIVQEDDDSKKRFLKYLKVYAISKNRLDLFDLWKNLYSKSLDESENIDQQLLKAVKKSITKKKNLRFFDSAVCSRLIRDENVKEIIQEMLSALYNEDCTLLKEIVRKECNKNQFYVAEFLSKYEDNTLKYQTIILELVKDNYDNKKIIHYMINHMSNSIKKKIKNELLNSLEEQLLSDDNEEKYENINIILRRILIFDPAIIDHIKDEIIDNKKLIDILFKDRQFYFELESKQALSKIFDKLNPKHRKQFLEDLMQYSISKKSIENFVAWKILSTNILPHDININEFIKCQIIKIVSEYKSLEFFDILLNSDLITDELFQKLVKDVLEALYKNNFKLLNEVNSHSDFDYQNDSLDFILKYDSNEYTRHKAIFELLNKEFDNSEIINHIEGYFAEINLQNIKAYVNKFDLLNYESIFSENHTETYSVNTIFHKKSQKIKILFKSIIGKKDYQSYEKTKIKPELMMLYLMYNNVEKAKEIFLELDNKTKEKYMLKILNHMFSLIEKDSSNHSIKNLIDYLSNMLFLAFSDKDFVNHRINKIVDELFNITSNELQEYVQDKMIEYVKKYGINTSVGNYWLIHFAPLIYLEEHTSDDLIINNFELGLTEGSPLFVKNVCKLVENGRKLGDIYRHDLCKYHFKPECAKEFFKHQVRQLNKEKSDIDINNLLKFTSKSILNFKGMPDDVQSKGRKFIEYLRKDLNSDISGKKLKLGKEKQQHFLSRVVSFLDKENQISTKELCDLVREALSNRSTNPILVNRGTGAYYWQSFFKKKRNPIDSQVCRSTSEAKLIDLYTELERHYPDHFAKKPSNLGKIDSPDNDLKV